MEGGVWCGQGVQVVGKNGLLDADWTAGPAGGHRCGLRCRAGPSLALTAKSQVGTSSDENMCHGGEFGHYPGSCRNRKNLLEKAPKLRPCLHLSVTLNVRYFEEPADGLARTSNKCRRTILVRTTAGVPSALPVLSIRGSHEPQVLHTALQSTIQLGSLRKRGVLNVWRSFYTRMIRRTGMRVLVP